MSVTVQWANPEQTILHFEYTGKWTWAEVFPALHESQQMMNQVNHPVASIVDLTDGKQLPLDSMKYLDKVVEARAEHANDSGITIFLNAQVLTKAMLDFIELKNPQAIPFISLIHAKTYDEAVEKAGQLLIKSPKEK